MKANRPHVSAEAKSGNLFLMFIGALLAASGGLFCVLMWSSFSHAMELRSWPQTSAEILSTQVLDRQKGDATPPEFAAQVIYGYQFEGKAFTSIQIDYRGLKWSKERSKAEDLLGEFPVGSQQPAWVNPDKPEEAILKLPTKAAIYSIWFPGLFFVGGLGIIATAGKKMILG